MKGLTNGIEYTFLVRAVSPNGRGEASDPVRARPIGSHPAPQDLTATAGDGQVTLSWTDPVDPTIEQWQYRLDTSKVLGPWLDGPSGATATSHVVTGLTNGIEYRFRVRAVSSIGTGTRSGVVRATPLALPAAPQGLAATAGDGQVTLSWTDPGDPTVTKWQYRWNAGDGFGPWLDGPSGATATSHVVTGLTNGIEYRFRVRAVSSIGTGTRSGVVRATPLALPAAPQGLAATAGDGQVTLSWTDPGDPTVTKWQYRWNAGDGFGPWLDGPSGATATSHVVTGLTNGIEYRFRVRAVSSIGTGTRSGVVRATPLALPAAPQGLAATAGDGQVTLSWTDPGDPTVTKWQYSWNAGDGFGPWLDGPSGATATSHVATGLTNGVEHSFRVRAVNPVGNGAPSDTAKATPAGPPAAPLGLAATAGDGQVTLSWTDPGDPTITKWQYSWNAGDGFGPWLDGPSGATATSHVATGLTNGVEHSFRVRAVNPVGNGAPSDTAKATPAGPPAAPLGLAATAGDGQVSLSWTDPGDPTVTKWQYSWNAGDGFGPWLDGPSGATATSHVVTGLTNGVEHSFRVRAVNPVGNGAPSDTAKATPAGPPAAPLGLAATAGDGQVTLSWTDPGDPTVTKWQYSWNAGDGFGPWLDGPSGATATSHVATGLTNGVEHSFRVRAVNPVGNGAPSDTAKATPAGPPAAPLGLAATAGDGQVTLSWTDPGDPTITKWQYSWNAGDGFGPWLDGPSEATATSHVATGLTNGVEHSFRVRAVNPVGNGAPSDTAKATPAGPPAAPRGLAATAGDGQVTLSWTDPGNPTITKWQYTWNADDGFGPWLDGPSEATATSHVVTGLTNGVAHSFRVRAVNPDGNGAPSDTAKATPAGPPAAPLGLAATAGDGQVTLSWTDPGNPTIAKWQYRWRIGDRFGSWLDGPTGATETSYVVTGLMNGELHRLRIRAVSTTELVGAQSILVRVTPYQEGDIGRPCNSP